MVNASRGRWMPRPWQRVWQGLLRCGLLLTLLLSASACEAEPRRYEFGVQTVGGPTGWPVWIEELTFDHSWGSPAGNLGGGFDIRPPTGGATVILGRPMPAPSSLQARWFSYRTQTFYEINLALPEMDALLRQQYRDYPPSRYRHYLVAGFSGEGEVFVWWRGWCHTCGHGRNETFHAPIVESAHAQEVEGDPNWYYEHTLEYIDEGTIPSPW